MPRNTFLSKLTPGMLGFFLFCNPLELRNQEFYHQHSLEQKISVAENKKSEINPGKIKIYDHEYDSGYYFTEGEKQELRARGYSPQAIEKFNHRFAGCELINFARKNIRAEQACAYETYFDGHEILLLIEAGISPEIANQYAALHLRSGAYGVTELETAQVPFEFSKQLRQLEFGGENPRLTPRQIISLYQKIKNAEEIRSIAAYSSKFTNMEVTGFFLHDIPPEKANQFLALKEKYNVTMPPETLAEYMKENALEKLEKEMQETYEKNAGNK
jgi:hypothetical protein